MSPTACVFQSFSIIGTEPCVTCRNLFLTIPKAHSSRPRSQQLACFSGDPWPRFAGGFLSSCRCFLLPSLCALPCCVSAGPDFLSYAGIKVRATHVNPIQLLSPHERPYTHTQLEGSACEEFDTLISLAMKEPFTDPF